jgi:CxxC motif-containing protein
MAFLKTLTVTRPLGCGDPVAENVLGLDCNVIATDHILTEGQ